MGAAEEMELDLKLGEKMYENKQLREKNLELRRRITEAQKILNRMITDPQVAKRDKMTLASILDALHESP